MLQSSTDFPSKPGIVRARSKLYCYGESESRLRLSHYCAKRWELFARFGAPHMICGMNACFRMLLAHVPSQPSAPSTDLPKPFPTSLCHEKNVIDLQVCGAGPSALLRTRAAAPAVESWFPTATATRLSFYYCVVEIKPLAFEASANRQLVLGRSPFSLRSLPQDMGNCGTGEKRLFENIPSIQ